MTVAAYFGGISRQFSILDQPHFDVLSFLSCFKMADDLFGEEDLFSVFDAEKSDDHKIQQKKEQSHKKENNRSNAQNLEKRGRKRPLREPDAEGEAGTELEGPEADNQNTNDNHSIPDDEGDSVTGDNHQEVTLKKQKVDEYGFLSHNFRLRPQR